MTPLASIIGSGFLVSTPLLASEFGNLAAPPTRCARERYSGDLVDPRAGKRGLPIICIDARLARKALSGRINKSDVGDAEGFAHLARTGWFSKVHIRSEASERVRVLIGTRERLIRMRKDL